MFRVFGKACLPKALYDLAVINLFIFFATPSIERAASPVIN